VVTRLSTEGDSFAPERFFALAAERLDREPRSAGARGDHILNPGVSLEGRSFRDAAVLIPVVARHPSSTILLTQRTPHLSAHAGQIAFPGGKIDPDDAGAGAAALREAQEEIGLDPAAVHVVGYLDAYLTGTGYRVIPVVGRVEPDQPFVLNRNEVEAAFEVPLSFLMTPANHHRAMRVLGGRERHFYEMPFERRYIWGITAGIIRGLYERIYA
jgi:8-oxo-dGTP pyrophosphatase MutT (NUDIX family)